MWKNARYAEESETGRAVGAVGDVDSGWWEGCLAVGDDDRNAGCCVRDMPVAQMTVSVFVDAKQAKEGERAGTPVASAFEGGVVQKAMEGQEICHRDCGLGRGHLISMEVLNAAFSMPRRTRRKSS